MISLAASCQYALRGRLQRNDPSFGVALKYLPVSRKQQVPPLRRRGRSGSGRNDERK